MLGALTARGKGARPQHLSAPAPWPPSASRTPVLCSACFDRVPSLWPSLDLPPRPDLHSSTAP